jgi:hypothetical protein
VAGVGVVVRFVEVEDEVACRRLVSRFLVTREFDVDLLERLGRQVCQYLGLGVADVQSSLAEAVGDLAVGDIAVLVHT